MSAKTEQNIKDINKNSLYGHMDIVQDMLRDWRNTEKVNYVWLLSGISGVGKSHLSRLFIKYILSSQEATETSSTASIILDDESIVHSKVSTNSYLNYYEISKERGNQNISGVRDLLEWNMVKLEDWKIIFIDSTEDLNKSCQNALLKVLEESSVKTIIIMTSERGDMLLPTILSRSREWHLSPLSTTDMQAGLSSISKEDCVIDINELISFSEGSLGTAISLLDGDTLPMIEELEVLIDSPTKDFNINALNFCSKYAKGKEMHREFLSWAVKKIREDLISTQSGEEVERLSRTYELYKDIIDYKKSITVLSLKGSSIYYEILVKLYNILKKN
ncbi:MAG: AAA family ATPase [Alphaproteobacteria bacterium]|nr:AAA family ATPase [Alphaproteobacteria bacterium]MBL0718255.1 AAA family ATPase [Alphaproteobacteria bacterium]